MSLRVKSGATTVRGGQLKRAVGHVFLLKTVDLGAMGGQKDRLITWPGCLLHYKRACAGYLPHPSLKFRF